MTLGGGSQPDTQAYDALVIRPGGDRGEVRPVRIPLHSALGLGTIWQGLFCTRRVDMALPVEKVRKAFGGGGTQRR